MAETQTARTRPEQGAAPRGRTAWWRRAVRSLAPKRPACGPTRRRGCGALAGLLLLGAVPGGAGCAHTHDALEQRLTTLEGQLEELKRGDRSVAVRLEDVENRLLLLRDELDTRKTVLYRDRYAPAPARTFEPAPVPAYEPVPAWGGAPAPSYDPSPLPTVKLTPPEPPPAAARPVSAEPFAYDQLDSYGYRVSGDGLVTTPGPGGLDDAPVAVLAADPVALADPGPTFSPAEERRAASEYRKAYELVQKSRFPQAQKQLEAFVTRWPTHQLADNALYWLGETLYAQKKYLEALQAFQRVIRDYPDGNKVPDAMLKTGLCYQNLGEPTQARKVLLQVAEIYPGSGAAGIALERARSLR